MAVSASAPLSKAKYVTERRPSAAAEMPRRLMPASASARLILVPSPARSGPSTRTECRLSVVVSPLVWAAPFCFAPLIGARKTTPVPGLSGARREMRNSKFAPASLKALNFSASPPGRSAISPAHTSTFLIVYAMLYTSLKNLIASPFTSLYVLRKQKTDHSNIPRLCPSDRLLFLPPPIGFFSSYPASHRCECAPKMREALRNLSGSYHHGKETVK